MKRIILATLCVIFSVGLFAQKALIIYKKDGTKMEIPLKRIEGFEFVGKGLVHDGEYISLSNMQLHSGVNLDATFTVNFHSDNPYIKEATPSYSNNWGILYSTTPNVTIESGELIQLDNSQTNTLSNLANGSVNALIGKSSSLSGLTNRNPINLEYETTYYIRAFVRSEVSNNVVKHFYSNEISINTGKPSMAYYGVTVDPAEYTETGYILPTDNAWASLAERYSYFTVKGSCKDALANVWRIYMLENIASIKSQCNTVYECREGMLYILDNIDDNFMEYALEYYNKEFTTRAWTEDYTNANLYPYLCDTTWNIQDKTYYEYKAISKMAKPAVTVPLSQPLLADYNYKVEITFVPDVAGADTLPTKYDFAFYGLNEKAKSTKLVEVKNQLTDAGKVTVASFDSISTKSFGEASIDISVNASLSELRNNVYTNTIRISSIKVIPVGPINKDEE